MITRIGRNVLEEIKAASVSMQNTEQETSVGTQLAQEAGTALESLFAVVEHQATEIETINQMANQQMQSSSTVVQLMQAVTTTTHQSNISTREASQQIEKLARLAEQLRASVEAFKPREEPSYHPLTSNTKTTISSEPPKQFTLSGKVRTITSSAQFVPSYDAEARQPVASGQPAFGSQLVPYQNPAQWGRQGQGYPQQQNGYPGQGYPQQNGYPGQGYPQQQNGYPGQGYPQQQDDHQEQAYPPQQNGAQRNGSKRPRR